MMEKITGWIQSHGEGLGIEKLPGHRPISSLAIPMMTLCVIEQLKTMDPSLNYDDLTDWAIKDAMKHVQVKCIMDYSFSVSWVLLNVTFGGFIFVTSRAYWIFREKGR